MFITKQEKIVSHMTYLGMIVQMLSMTHEKDRECHKTGDTA